MDADVKIPLSNTTSMPVINGLYNSLRIDEWIVKLDDGIIQQTHFYAWCMDSASLLIEQRIVKL